MSAVFRKFFGVLLILAAIIGLLFSISGIVLLWRVQAQIATGLQEGVAILIQTLDTTSQGLEVTQTALESSVASIQAMQSTVETTVKTVNSAGPMVAQISNIMENDLPETILATQQSLQTASESAKVIDGVLRTMSGIPLIGSSIGYNPEVPLNEALDKVSNSLENLPSAFIDMQDSLAQTNNNLETFEADLSTVAASIGGIEKSVAQYKNVVSGYQDSLDQLKTRLKVFSSNLPNILRLTAIGLTVFLVWMTIAQIGLFAQGWEMLTRKDIEKMVEAELAEQKAEDEAEEKPAES